MSFSETLVTSLHLSSEYLENIFSKIVRFIQSNKNYFVQGNWLARAGPSSPGWDLYCQGGTRALQGGTWLEY